MLIGGKLIRLERLIEFVRNFQVCSWRNNLEVLEATKAYLKQKIRTQESNDSQKILRIISSEINFWETEKVITEKKKQKELNRHLYFKLQPKEEQNYDSSDQEALQQQQKCGYMGQLTDFIEASIEIQQTLASNKDELERIKKLFTNHQIPIKKIYLLIQFVRLYKICSWAYNMRIITFTRNRLMKQIAKGKNAKELEKVLRIVQQQISFLKTQEGIIYIRQKVRQQNELFKQIGYSCLDQFSQLQNGYSSEQEQAVKQSTTKSQQRRIENFVDLIRTNQIGSVIISVLYLKQAKAYLKKKINKKQYIHDSRRILRLVRSEISFREIQVLKFVKLKQLIRQRKQQELENQQTKRTQLSSVCLQKQKKIQETTASIQCQASPIQTGIFSKIKKLFRFSYETKSLSLPLESVNQQKQLLISQDEIQSENTQNNTNFVQEFNKQKSKQPELKFV